MTLLVALAAFVAMEAVTYVAHRWVMHGIGWVLHASHHRRAAARFQANDAFPVVFGGLTLLGMAVGYQVPLDVLVAATAGVSAYGLTYAFVHDLYIHGRLGRLPRIPVLDRLAAAHALHHRFNAEPYGMLAPYLPKALRERAVERPTPARDAAPTR